MICLLAAFASLSQPRLCRLTQQCLSTTNLWHLRLGHTNFDAIKTLSPKLPVKFDAFKSSDRPKCDTCFHSLEQQNLLLVLWKLLVSDVSGPYKIESHGFCYFLTITEHYSRYISVSPLLRKSEAAYHIRDFISRAESYRLKPPMPVISVRTLSIIPAKRPISQISGGEPSNGRGNVQDDVHILLALSEPLTFDEALRTTGSSSWKAAASDSEKMKSLEDNNTWKQLSLPKERKADSYQQQVGLQDQAKARWVC